MRSLEEVERHFWVTKVGDGDTVYETEVVITPARIKAYTCECWSAPRRLMCAHIAASLFKIRRYVQQEQEQRQERRSAASSSETAPKRLHIGEMVEAADAGKLRSFVRQYARENRDFALALKTWLAGETPQPGNPYALLLESVLPKNSTLDTLREQEAKRFIRTVGQLRRQAEEALREKHYTKTLHIALAVTGLWANLLQSNEMGKRQQALREDFSAILLHLFSLTSLEALSPQARQEAWERILFLTGKDLLNPLMQGDDLWDAALTAGHADARFQDVQMLFDRLPFPAPRFLLEWMTGLLIRRGSSHLAVRFLRDYQPLTACLYPLLIRLYEKQAFDTFVPVTDEALAHQWLTDWQRRDLENKRLRVAEQQGDTAYVKDFLYKRLLQKGTFEWYEKWKNTGPVSRESFQTLMQQLRERGFYATVAYILAQEAHTEDLKELLLHTPSWPLIETYIGSLFAEHPAFVESLYSERLTTYLQEHLGRPASSFVRDRLGALLPKTNQPFILLLMRTLAARFPERHTLPEELAELFPRMKPEKIFS